MSTEAKAAFLRELESANAVIRKAGALRVESDGFKWIDESLLPAEFCDYYGRLVSAGYAIGAL